MADNSSNYTNDPRRTPGVPKAEDPVEQAPPISQNTAPQTQQSVQSGGRGQGVDLRGIVAVVVVIVAGAVLTWVGISFYQTLF